ncbi:hypothetical protein Pse7367_2558 [Thalassoporum mexicanum PCC 7367]|uniref:DUF6930 domain-containing protein n=1 Tax=Thalassoporum mexicanum TaxID=3457544 RepID=UPI00029FBAC2|nr:hypothetical protein [Pseudanabaena sp. PCC 7367]AFY70816.1 hypothetical protein Pse7367_2558 [Pseudanabaena sp. PCC 7367]
MSTLNSLTLHRLQRLPRSSAIWEGDRRSLDKPHEHLEGTNLVQLNARLLNDAQAEYVLWVDGSSGIVRAMDVIGSNVGKEAVVRALLQAIERPQSPAQPSLPQKILICDRELQFYLRGVLQGLDITIEHTDRLPLIDEFFENILAQASSHPPDVPPERAPDLYQQAHILWQNAPWEYLWDHQVISIELNQWGLGTIYAVTMGRLGLEKGVIFYRSEESLLEFRHHISEEETAEDAVEETFLHQDCLFSLFEDNGSLSPPELSMLQSYGWGKEVKSNHGTHPIFGAIHPLEAGRPFLYEEEAIALTVILSAFNGFITQHKAKLKAGKFEQLSSKITLPTPASLPEPMVLKVKELKLQVGTQPNLSQEIHDIITENPFPDSTAPLIHEDLWPNNVAFRFLNLEWDKVDSIRQSPLYLQLAETDFPRKADALSVLLIQTSRPKAHALIEAIEDNGGIEAVCFNPAESIFGDKYDLGLVVLGTGELHLFGEFDHKKNAQTKSYRAWKKQCKTNQGRCAVIIAMGITSTEFRGKLAQHHIMAYYEVPLVSAQELGLGTISAQPILDYEFDL